MSDRDWRNDLLFALMVLAEGTLVWLIADFLLAGLKENEPTLPAWPVIALAAIANFVPRLLSERDWTGARYSFAMLTALLPSTLVAIKLLALPNLAWSDTDLFHEALQGLINRPSAANVSIWGVIAVSVFCWWRGNTRREAGQDAAVELLRIGAPVAVAAAIGQSFVRDDSRNASIAVVAFFALALSAIAISRMLHDGLRKSPPLGKQWLVAMLAPVGAILLATVIVAAVFSREVLDAIFWVLSPAFWVIWNVVRFGLIAFAFVIFVILYPFFWLLSKIDIAQPDNQDQQPTDPARDILDRAQQQSGDVDNTFRYIIAAVVLVILVLLVLRFVRRRQAASTTTVDEERSSVLGEVDLFGYLKSLFGGLGRRSAPPDPLAALRGDPRWRYTIAIREQYASFLRWAERTGRARTISMTPAEHARRIDPVDRDLRELTRIYDETRYGAEPATADAANRARAAFDAVVPKDTG
jgi:hypothetical protein